MSEEADIAKLEAQHNETYRRLGDVEKVSEQNSKDIAGLVTVVTLMSRIVFGGLATVLLAVLGAATKLLIKG